MGGTHCDGFSGTLRDAADSGRSWELGAGAEQYPVRAHHKNWLMPQMAEMRKQ